MFQGEDNGYIDNNMQVEDEIIVVEYNSSRASSGKYLYRKIYTCWTRGVYFPEKLPHPSFWKIVFLEVSNVCMGLEKIVKRYFRGKLNFRKEKYKKDEIIWL